MAGSLSPKGKSRLPQAPVIGGTDEANVQAVKHFHRDVILHARTKQGSTITAKECKMIISCVSQLAYRLIEKRDTDAPLSDTHYKALIETSLEEAAGLLGKSTPCVTKVWEHYMKEIKVEGDPWLDTSTKLKKTRKANKGKYKHGPYGPRISAKHKAKKMAAENGNKRKKPASAPTASKRRAADSSSQVTV